MYRLLFLLFMLVCGAAWADSDEEELLPVDESREVEVVSVTWSSAKLRETRQQCWDEWISVAQLNQEQGVEKNGLLPWIPPIIGALMGAYIGYRLGLPKDSIVTTYTTTLIPYDSTVVYDPNLDPNLMGLNSTTTVTKGKANKLLTLAGAGIGAAVGPGGVTGGVLGAAVGSKIGKGKGQMAAVLAGAIVGGGIGKKVFDKFWGILTADEPNPIKLSMPLTEYRQVERCGEIESFRMREDDYTVVYQFNGEERSVTLGYDPGDTVWVSTDGNLDPAKN